MRKRVQTVDRDTALQMFVEEVGLQFESSGAPRMAGRLFGHLLVCDPPEQTAEEMARAVQASRASVSTMTRLLIQIGLVERQLVPGARRDRFRVRPGSFSSVMRTRLMQLTLFRHVLARGLLALADEPSTRSERLREILDLYTYLEQELPRLLDRYEAERARKRR
jgi:DNA-binding transcriptional regulator GbsR (MarR family)